MLLTHFAAGSILCLALAAAEMESSITTRTGSNADPVLAMKQFRVPPGLAIELFAAEPQLANPVAFTIDERGNVYVAETYRHSAVGAAYRYFEGALDIRSHMDWLDDELALKSVDDRVEMLKRKVGPDIEKFKRLSEQVRLIKDTDGDGRADFSTVFAEGFDQIADGIGAGVLARDGKVYYTCIPNLWLLEDNNGDGRAEKRTSIHDGFGVHIAYLGHDLHGLIFGPDGRLYFSIGDRGINVKTKEGRRLYYPDEGTVLRCDPDGSNLEVFARGLRNPQELAFDQYGNLFTGDNNSDGGDRARWVYLVEGGDSGWRIGYQHLNAGPRRGPWNAEKLWYPQWEGQAAYIVPPLANLGYGPSGLAYYPGMGLSPKYDNHFFLCDFRGGASSGIHTFTVKPKGASFELDAYEQFVWETLPTDVEFGPDGSIYFSDWIESWQKTGRGRIYRVYNPELKDDPGIAKLRELMPSMPKQSDAELEKLLAHTDMRIRQRAQFALADSGANAADIFLRVLQTQTNQLARIHSIWGLGQLARKNSSRLQEHLAELATFARHIDPEIRAQVLKVLGEARYVKAFDIAIEALRHESPRVRYFAALTLGKFGNEKAIEPVLRMVAENAERDPVLRHAAVMALVSTKKSSALMRQANHKSRAVRMAVLLAMRRLEDKRVAHFLNDGEFEVALEAARAINDVPINDAMTQLAALIGRSTAYPSGTRSNIVIVNASAALDALSSIVPETATTSPYEQLFQRVINANFREGKPANAKALSAFVLREESGDALRAEALGALADWEKPSGRDRVMGLWRPLKPRDAKPAREAMTALLPAILSQSSETVQAAALEGVQKLDIRGANDLLVKAAEAESTPAKTRASILKLLLSWNSSELPAVLAAVQKSSDPALLAEARAVRAQLDPAATVAELASTLRDGPIKEKQAVIALLGNVRAPQFTKLLAEWLDRLLARQTEPELELDLLDAASRQGAPELLAKVQAYEKARPKTFLGPVQETLHGGDAAAGRSIFFERAEVFCSRCHMLGNEGGQAGPNLTGIGGKQSREYLLESIAFPNLKIAEGWENALITLKDGSSYAGKLTKEDDLTLVIDSPEDGEVTIKKSEIKSRERALSAMPDEFRQILTKQDLRNLVEFLASQKN